MVQGGINMYNYPNYTNYNANTPRQNAFPDERIWVQNETSAEAFLLAPSGFARLWDSSQPRFYEKRADATGRPLHMEIYEYKRVTPQINAPTEEVNKLPLEDINAKIEAINERIDRLEQKKGAVKNATKSNADDTSV